MPETPFARGLLGLAEQLGALEPQPPTEAMHYEALGRFIAAFANAESSVHIVARKLTALTEDKARLIFGGLRLKDVSDRVRSLIAMDDVKQDTRKVIDDCLTQLSNISSRRHNLVHRGATYHYGALLSTNSLTARSIKSIEVEKIEERTLVDMEQDCRAIFLRLLDAVDPSGADPKFAEHLSRYSWRYKHAPPKPKNQQPRKVPRGQKRQPDASQA